MPEERLDVYLKSRFPSISRGTIQRLLRQGCIRINDQPVKATHHPRRGEIIEMHFPPPKPSKALPQPIQLDILFEDEDMLFLNKRPGMVVHPSAGHEEDTLVNALLHHCGKELSGIGGISRPGIVHRLDQHTSGCLVVAKNDKTHLHLAEQFAERRVQKIYRAIVCGFPEPLHGEIRTAIARHPNHRKRMAVADGSGRDAWTTYRVLEALQASSHVEAVLHTGRTHQIRVHFLHLGHPLVGDTTYGKRHNLRFREASGFVAPRHMLHALSLRLEHPRSGTPLHLEAPLPEDFLHALATLAVKPSPIA